MTIYGRQKSKERVWSKGREPRGQQSSLGGAECLGDEVSAYPSLKGGQDLKFYS